MNPIVHVWGKNLNIDHQNEVKNLHKTQTTTYILAIPTPILIKSKIWSNGMGTTPGTNIVLSLDLACCRKSILDPLHLEREHYSITTPHIHQDAFVLT